MNITFISSWSNKPWANATAENQFDKRSLENRPPQSSCPAVITPAGNPPDNSSVALSEKENRRFVMKTFYLMEIFHIF